MPALSEELVNKLRLDGLRDVTSGNHAGRRRLQTESCHELCNQCIEIETYLHLMGTNFGFGPVIPHPPNSVSRAQANTTSVSKKNFFTSDDIKALFKKNIAVVNRAFVGTPFRFTFMAKNTTTTINRKWSEAAADYKEEIGQAVGIPNLRKLNVIVSREVRPRGHRKGDILGTATLPGSQSVGKGDGVYIRYDVLAGGGRAKNDLGYTLVHEIGMNQLA